MARPQLSPGDPAPRPVMAAPADHIAYFYEGADALDLVLAAFAQDGLAANETVVIFARPPRLAALTAGRWPLSLRLAQHQERGELVILDAEAVLASLMIDGRIEARAFAEHISKPLDALRARAPGTPIRIYGELGDILVARRQYDAAVTLAALWHHEVARAPVQRLSAYALESFVGPDAGIALERLCRLHVRVRLDRQPDLDTRGAGYWAVLARQRERERVRLTAALAEAERRAQVGMLAAGLAHDLSNLLMPVLQQAEDIAAMAGDEGRRAAESVLHGTQQAAELVKAMMRVATPAPATTPVSLHKVATLVLTVLRSRLEGVKVKLEVDADLPLVAGHESSLLQVLLNLVQNAREAMPGEGGAITVSLARCASPAGGGDDWVRMSVTDTGVGMDAAQQARLFEPFYTTKANGHGIGLASVRTLVEVMGGRIDVHSTPGRGTVFAVRIRAAASPFR